MGYGGVAKCVLHYFPMYFNFDYKNIFIIDKCETTIYGPNLTKIQKKNIVVMDINSNNFDNLVKSIGLGVGDIIIDMTFMSNSYYFIQCCLLEGFNYINTSIEDNNDSFIGTSIDLQQKIVKQIYQNCKLKTKIRSNILTEFGQNPGLIQHYVLYSLNEMQKKYNNTNKDDFRKETLQKVINDYKIGTIFCSEIDNIVKHKDTPMKQDTIYNTWSVGGMLSEGLDKTELVCGMGNKFIKPSIPKKIIDTNKMKILPKYKNQGYEVIFLKKTGIQSTLNSICPIIDKNGKIKFVNFRGSMIHHGETFELGQYFGKNSPFITYVYKLNKYADKSIRQYFKKNKLSDDHDLKMQVLNDCSSFSVLNNINKKSNDSLVGHDSIGCTIFCGKDKIDNIFWCGSILSHDDKNVDSNFTPTIVQVAAGLLSGLSYILEEKNKAHGLYEPCDLDTKYILNKSIPLLGKFFFTEIPREKFVSKIEYKVIE